MFSNSSQQFIQAVEEFTSMDNEQIIKMGRNGLEFLEEYYSTSLSYELIEKEINKNRRKVNV